MDFIKCGHCGQTIWQLPVLTDDLMREKNSKQPTQQPKSDKDPHVILFFSIQLCHSLTLLVSYCTAVLNNEKHLE